VGLRFTNVTVPSGAIVLGATIQFRAGAASSGPAQLTLQGQADDNPTTFVALRQSISFRPRTAAAVSWTPPSWESPGEAGAAQRTADLTSVIQEIIDRPGWASGNALAIIITGTGHRVATSHEAGDYGAALLHIEYGGLASAAPAHRAASPAPAHEATAPVSAGLADGSRLSLAAPIDPPRFEFALRGASTQPSHGPLVVEFTLADNGPAVLELHDPTGRRVATREVGALGPGAHAIKFSERLPAGIYLVRLTQRDRTLLRKAIILR
jgi:hypothetical protein